MLAEVVPVGMLFVPSARGISHDPSERTRWEDCVNGANALLGAALVLATEPITGSRSGLDPMAERPRQT